MSNHGDTVAAATAATAAARSAVEALSDSDHTGAAAAEPPATTDRQSKGIAFADAFRLLSERKACDHEHSVRPFFDGAPLPAAQEASAAAELPSFEPRSDEDVHALSAVELLVDLLKLQEQRVAVYRHFDAAFERLLETRNFTPYKQACARVTQRFAQLSQGVRLVRDCLRALPAGCGGLCDTISSLQDAEKRKLETTAQLQVLRQHLSLQVPGAMHHHDHHDDATTTIAAAGGGGGGGDGDGSHDHAQQHGPHQVEHGSPTPSAQDLAEGVRLQTAALVTIVEEINEIVDEIRCERVDMMDQ